MTAAERNSSLPSVVALLAAGAWLAVHFFGYLTDPWWRAPAEGEWDILLTARAAAAGAVPRAATGSIHGFEIGSYLVGLLAAVPIRLGLDPTLTSRYLAALIGSAGAGLVAGTAFAFSRAAGRNPAVGSAVAAALAIVVWPHWHFANLGLTGTTIESSILLTTLFALLAWDGPTPRAGLAGAVFGMAALFSPIALVALPPLCLTAIARSSPSRVLTAAKFLGGALLPPLAAALILPGGVAAVLNVGWSWTGLLGEAVGGEVWAPLRVLGPTAPVEFFGSGWAAVATVLGVAMPASAAVLVGSRQSTAGERRWGGYTLSWGILLAVVPRSAADLPEAARYWSVYLMLGFVAIGLLVSRLPGRWQAVGGAVVALVAAGGLYAAPTALPPAGRALVEVMATAGSHRTPERLGGREGLSDRHGTFIDLVEHVPEDHRSAFSQAYGLAVADDLTGEGLTEWWVEWELQRLRPHVRPMIWADFVFGLGCGVAVSRIDPQRGRLLEALGDADAPSFGLGFGHCEAHGAQTRPPKHLRAGAETCRSLGRSAGPRLLHGYTDPRIKCTTPVRPAVKDLWTYADGLRGE